jgi:hypothetical protein
MPAGAPVRKRTNGFGSDMTSLSRLRAAILIDRTLPDTLKEQAIGNVDKLLMSLGALDELIIERRANQRGVSSKRRTL